MGNFKPKPKPHDNPDSNCPESEPQLKGEKSPLSFANPDSFYPESESQPKGKKKTPLSFANHDSCCPEYEPQPKGEKSPLSFANPDSCWPESEPQPKGVKIPLSPDSCCPEGEKSHLSFANLDSFCPESEPQPKGERTPNHDSCCPESEPQPNARVGKTDTATKPQLATELEAKPIPKPHKKKVVQVQATAHENIKYELKALKHYESEFISCLQNADLNLLACKAAESGLVSGFLKDVFKFLDPSVPRQLLCRYLILNVYKGIKTSDDFKLWLKLLTEIKGTGGIVSQVRRCFDYLTQISGSGHVPGTRDEGITFSELHIQDLTEILAGCSSKWKEIAISLRLPSNEIENIIMSQSRPILCLNKIIELWVRGQFDSTKPPTYKVLKQALCSELAGLGSEASRLEENLAKYGITFSEDNFFFVESKISEDFKICSQSQNIIVTEGTVVLFQIRVSGNSSAEFIWYKDGKAWPSRVDNPDRIHTSSLISRVNEHIPDTICSKNIHSKNYYGNNESILCINVEDLTLEGSYTCEVKHKNEVLYSKPILLTVKTPLDKHIKLLTDKYSEQPEVPKDTWPPVSVSTYINLALIKQGIHKVGEYYHCTIRGDADDIFRDKEDIAYEEAFSGLSSRARLLIEGRPGSGKTTLVHMVSQNWAKKKIKFNHVRLLFLIHLRGFSNNPNIKLHDLLNCYFSDNPGLEDIKQYAMKHNGLGLCFILDGLDEYLPNNKSAYIFKLIQKEVLPNSVVIVASRPAAASDFRSVATMQVEVLGFLKNQIKDYIHHYAFSVNSKYPELCKYLDEHPNIHHMCYLPIHASMVCFLYDNLGSDLPQTETKIYAEFAKYTMLRMLYRDESDTCIKSIKNLPSLQKNLYFKICQLAFEMCVSSRQVMEQVEVRRTLF